MKYRLAVLALSATACGFFPAAQAAPAAPSDAELQKFVAASVDVDRINKAAQAEQAKAKTPAEAAKLEDEADRRMEKAVAAKGLSTDRFTQIYEVMQADPKVRARVTELAKQQTGSK